MVYFKSDFNEFFKELAANNHKLWFDENRQRYIQNIKAPFEAFVTALIADIQKFDPQMQIDAKDSIFRINRDIRFSKDKTPYKLNRSAFISPYGKKAGGYPGFYLQIGPEKVMIGGGVYQPNKDDLQKIRRYIISYTKKFQRAISDPQFVEVYGELLGEKNKRLPSAEYTRAALEEPLIYNKQFYFMAEFPPEIITDNLFLDFVAEKFKDALIVMDVLQEATNRDNIDS